MKIRANANRLHFCNLDPGDVFRPCASTMNHETVDGYFMKLIGLYDTQYNAVCLSNGMLSQFPLNHPVQMIEGEFVESPE